MAQDNSNPRETRVTRRRILHLLGGGMTAAAAPAVFARTADAATGSRHLELHHLHTGEKIAATYWSEGRYDRAVLGSIDRLLRDFRTGDIHPIEPALLDQLDIVRRELGTDAPFQVIGGYRSPKTNEMLRRQSTGVAKRSLHMLGRAIDVRLVDTNSRRLREVAADLRLGGVGYYAKSNFVHLDTGRPRVW